MLITHNLRLTHILKTTWKVDILSVLTCIIVFLIHEYLLQQAVKIPATLVTLLGTGACNFCHADAG